MKKEKTPEGFSAECFGDGNVAQQIPASLYGRDIPAECLPLSYEAERLEQPDNPLAIAALKIVEPIFRQKNFYSYQAESLCARYLAARNEQSKKALHEIALLPAKIEEALSNGINQARLIEMKECIDYQPLANGPSLLDMDMSWLSGHIRLVYLYIVLTSLDACANQNSFFVKWRSPKNAVSYLKNHRRNIKKTGVAIINNFRKVSMQNVTNAIDTIITSHFAAHQMHKEGGDILAINLKKDVDFVVPHNFCGLMPNWLVGSSKIVFEYFLMSGLKTSLSTHPDHAILVNWPREKF